MITFDIVWSAVCWRTIMFTWGLPLPRPRQSSPTTQFYKRSTRDPIFFPHLKQSLWEWNAGY